MGKFKSILLLWPAAAFAQLPNAPVLQNAWATPGIVGAVNVGGGTGGSMYAAAAAWAPSSGRFQLSGGAGMISQTGSGSRATYGVRVALPLMRAMEGQLGLAAFGGIGGGGGTSTDTTAVKTLAPIGVAVGYRRAFAGRGVSFYGSPSYQWSSGAAGSGGGIRLGLGLDVGLASNIGITGGIELGQAASAGKVGPRGTLYGVGASYAFGR